VCDAVFDGLVELEGSFVEGGAAGVGAFEAASVVAVAGFVEGVGVGEDAGCEIFVGGGGGGDDEVVGFDGTGGAVG
jgi:hypothetical protein